jgi:hypothetical protein
VLVAGDELEERAVVVLEALEDDGAGGLLVGVALAAVAVEGLQREHVRVVHARAEVGRPD